MNARDTMPACARIAEVSPDLADRMWNTVTGDDGRDLVDERMRAKGRVLCSACPMRLDCISRAHRRRLEGQGRVRRPRIPKPLDPRPADRPRPARRHVRPAPDPATSDPRMAGRTSGLGRTHAQ